MNAFERVTGGRFYCEECGNSWVGTWHGSTENMTCPWCHKSMPDPHRSKGCVQGCRADYGAGLHKPECVT